jgi:thymidylate kinase
MTLTRLVSTQATSRRGLTVALLGPDGAGKSTLVTAVEARFDAPVRTLYMGLNLERVPLANRVAVPALRIPVFFLVLWWHYAVGLFHKSQGRLVIFDRYTYDALLPARTRLTRLGRLSRWVRAHALPAPDMVLVLDVPGVVMFARKGEHSPEHLEAERQDYLALAAALPEVTIVDGARPVDAVAADVVARIQARRAALAGRSPA